MERDETEVPGSADTTLVPAINGEAAFEKLMETPKVACPGEDGVTTTEFVPGATMAT